MDIKKLKNDYFFCYTKELAKFLRYEKKIEYVSKTKHITSDKILTIFERTEYLDKAISEYNEMKKEEAK